MSQILFLSRWFPYPPSNGSKLRIFNLLRGLAEAGHSVRLLSFVEPDYQPTSVRARPGEDAWRSGQDDLEGARARPDEDAWRSGQDDLEGVRARPGEDAWRSGQDDLEGVRARPGEVDAAGIDGLRPYCQSVWTTPWRQFAPASSRARLGFFSATPRSVRDTWSSEMAQMIEEELAQHRPDLIIASQIDTTAYVPANSGVPALFEEIEIGLMMEQYTAAVTLGQRLRYGLTWAKYRRYLASLLGRFAACTVVSQREQQLLAAAAPRFPPAEIIPNCLHLPDYQPTNPPIYQSTNLPTHQSTNLPTHQSTNPPTHQSTNLPTHQSTNLPTHQSTNLPTHQSTNPPTHQSTNPPTHQSTNLPTHQSTNPPTHQSTNPPTHQSTNPPTHQSTNLPTHQLIFTGAFTYHVNYEGALWFVERVLPLVQAQISHVRLTITGNHADLPFPQIEAVVRTGFVDDVRPLIAGADVCVVPIWQGGGTRLKILEAMALGTPVVATSKGAEGLDAQSGIHLLIADQPAAFADAVVQLLTDPSLRQRLAEHGRTLVEQHYSWSLVMPRFLHLVERLTAANRQHLSGDQIEH